MKVKEAELTFTLLEGEKEEEFLKKAREDMKDRRKRGDNFKGGRRNAGYKRKHDGETNNTGKRRRH